MKRVLICTYTFPPTGGPRSIRWIQFAEHLTSKGWGVDILTVNPLPKSPRYDAESLRAIPAKVAVHRTFPGIMYSFGYRYASRDKVKAEGKRGKKSMLFNRMLKKFDKMGRSLLIPDGAIEWLPFALRKGRMLCRRNRYDALISVGYPYASHIVGYFLRKYVKGPWIADYGDPWSFFPHFLPPWRRAIDGRLEGRLLKRMDRVIVTTEETKEGYLSHFPFLSPEKVEVIPQGYSREQFSAVAPERSEGFRIVYTGIFYGKIREPFTFFNAIGELDDIDLEVVVAGRVEGLYREYIRKRGLGNKIRFIGYVSHERAVALQKGATLLLLLGNLSRYQLPSKVYEYLASQRPILSIRYQEADIASNMVEKYRRGLVVENDKERIKGAVRELYSDWKEGSLERKFNLKEVEEYSWDTIDVKFESMLNDLCGVGEGTS
ncbi:MAG: glycosyltransferase [Thermodesulfobacteriota bacterium]